MVVRTCRGREIDQLNILQASLLAMQRAIAGLSITPEQVLVDGQHCPKITYPVEANHQRRSTDPSH